MVILPGYVEQYLNARRVEALGAAVVVGADRSREDLETVLHDILENGDYRMQARSFASRNKGASVERSVNQAIEIIERATFRDYPTPQFMNA